MALHEKLDELRHSQIIGMRDEIAQIAEQLKRIDERLAPQTQQNYKDYITAKAFKPLRPNQLSYWQNYDKFFVSMMKAWCGDAATAERSNSWVACQRLASAQASGASSRPSSRPLVTMQLFCAGSALAQDSSAFDGLIGQTVAKNFRLVKRIGAGAMGRVYQAEQLSLGKMVAIKILRHELMADEKLVRRFELEARTASAVSHPNLIETFD